MSERDYGDVLTDMEELLKDAVRAFAAYYAREWKLTREQWEHDFSEPPPEGDWFEGHNRGVAGVVDAVEQFLDEVR